MSNLLERARALISSKPAVLGALAIVRLASAAGTAKASVIDSPYTFVGGGVYLHTPAGGGTDVPYSGTVGATGFNPITLYTNGPIDILSSTYDGSSYVKLLWTGDLGVAYFPVNNSTVSVHYDFTIGQSTSGGTVSWTLLDNIGGISLNASGTETTLGGSQEFTSTLTSPVTSPIGATWSSELDLAWSGEGPSTMTVNVPGAATIELSVAGVPEPASLGILGAGALGLLLRRRRRA